MNGAPVSLAGPEGSFVLEKPQALWALALLAVFILFRLILDRRYRGRRGLGFFALFASPGLEPAGGDSPFPGAAGENAGGGRTRTLRRRYYLSHIFFWLSLGCLIAALSGPRWGLRIVPEYRRGLDVVLALDLSRSMEARDLGLSRLERAAEIGREMTETMGGVRFGVAVSRGRGVLAVPLTGDSEAVFSFLAAAGASALTGSGTDLEALVDAASAAFTDSFPSRRVIVLLSDGEALSGSLNEAVDRARLREIALAAVGIGSDQGGPLSFEAGPPVISRRRPEALRSAAIKSGGIYIDGNSAEASRLLRSYLESLAFESGIGGGRNEKKARWNLFVIAALFLFGASKCCLLVRRDRRGGT
ncbi:MAG: VWA domain-containing protein [Treponema sp.]|jgi:Ca-activated chloride channel family protein|nr:VWA domain-containing protein [Treponema sp.]